MQIITYPDHRALSDKVADHILSVVKKKPDAVLCLAAGDTPKLAYSLLVEKAARESIDFSACTFVGLDEWVGIPPENEGSCYYFLQTFLFKPLGVDPAQIHLFNALAKDLTAECKAMDEKIREKGPVDLMLVGVGMNGHIGFNEPGVVWNLNSHVTNLDDTTRSVGQKYFKQSTPLQKGITLGLQHLLESKSVIVMASGLKKAQIMRAALEDPVSPAVPASVIRKHQQGLVMLDQEAATLLKSSIQRPAK